MTSVGSVADVVGLLSAPHGFDALLSDIGTPGEDGYALVRRFKLMQRAGKAHDIPAAALTAFTRDAYRAAALLEAGFDLFLPKPISPADLLRKIS
jgi:two-component system, chemotaxis family, CheB/CheR fusion protein